MCQDFRIFCKIQLFQDIYDSKQLKRIWEKVEFYDKKVGRYFFTNFFNSVKKIKPNVLSRCWEFRNKNHLLFFTIRGCFNQFGVLHLNYGVRTRWYHSPSRNSHRLTRLQICDVTRVTNEPVPYNYKP